MYIYNIHLNINIYVHMNMFRSTAACQELRSLRLKRYETTRSG